MSLQTSPNIELLPVVGGASARSDEGRHTLVELAWQAKRLDTFVVRADVSGRLVFPGSGGQIHRPGQLKGLWLAIDNHQSNDVKYERDRAVYGIYEVGPKVTQSRLA